MEPPRKRRRWAGAKRSRFSIFKDMTGQEKLPKPSFPTYMMEKPQQTELVSTGKPDEEFQEIVYKRNGESAKLRNYAGSVKKGESGPVWTIKINKPKLENDFEEIKFKR